MTRRRLAVWAAVLACLMGVAACGGSSHGDTREQALRARLAQIGKARISCKDDQCTVIVASPLHSNYEGFLLSVPVFVGLTEDRALADVKRVTLTLNDDASGQVFSITCAAGDLHGAPTPASLQRQCHSIYL